METDGYVVLRNIIDKQTLDVLQVQTKITEIRECFKINKTCNCIKCFFTLNCFCKISKKQNSKKLKNIISSNNIITNIEKLKKSIDVSELWDDSNI